jgi:hypothetical protein
VYPAFDPCLNNFTLPLPKTLAYLLEYGFSVFSSTLKTKKPPERFLYDQIILRILSYPLFLYIFQNLGF